MEAVDPASGCVFLQDAVTGESRWKQDDYGYCSSQVGNSGNAIVLTGSKVGCLMPAKNEDGYYSCDWGKNSKLGVKRKNRAKLVESVHSKKGQSWCETCTSCARWL